MTTKNSKLSKLHIVLLKQFEGPKTFTNFTKALLPQKRTAGFSACRRTIVLAGE